jgi:hypothetical protein
MRNQTGEKNPNWKGGRSKDRKNYTVNEELHKKRCGKYLLAHPEKRKETCSNYRVKNKKTIDVKRKLPQSKIIKRDGELKKAYGITFNQYMEMLACQNNKCAICGVSFEKLKNKQVHIDHDHKTNRVRQILCNGCNVGLGHFKDDVEKLESAIRYLKIWQQ